MEREVKNDVITHWRQMICEIVKIILNHSEFQEAIGKRSDYVATDKVLSHHRSFDQDKIDALKNKTKHANLYVSFLNLDRYLAHIQLSDYEFFDGAQKNVDSSDTIITIDYNCIMDISRDLLLDFPDKDDMAGTAQDFLNIVSCLKAGIVSQCASIIP